METRQFLFIAVLALAGASCSDSGDKTAQEQTDTQEESAQEQSDNQADNNEDATEEGEENSEESSEESKDDNALVDYVKTPIDKAKAVEDAVKEAAEQQRQAIDKATE